MSLAAPDRKQAPSAFVAKVAIAPYGVLGMHMVGRKCVSSGPPPDVRTAFVDPAGLHHIREFGPSQAGGAAGSIYEFIGIRDDDAFPREVRLGVKAELDAAFHCYDGRFKVIHAVGPDYRTERYENSDIRLAMQALILVYRNVLREFLSSGLPKLRLLPLSGGIFAGKYAKMLRIMTPEALSSAFARLDVRQQKKLMNAELIEICIFSDYDVQPWTDSFQKVAARLQRNETTKAGSLSPGGQDGPLFSARHYGCEAGVPRSPDAWAPSSPEVCRLGGSNRAAPPPTPSSPRRLALGGSPRNATASLRSFVTPVVQTAEEQGMVIGARPGTGDSLRRQAAAHSSPRRPAPDMGWVAKQSATRPTSKGAGLGRTGSAAMVPEEQAPAPRPPEAIAEAIAEAEAEAEVEAEAEAEAEDATAAGESPPAGGKAALRFDADWKACTVGLSKDQRSASWKGHPFGGFVLGYQPLRRQVVGRWFEVVVEEADATRWTDGMGIGVAMKPDEEVLKENADAFGRIEGLASELLPNSWLVGYDGERVRVQGHTRFLTDAELPGGKTGPKDWRRGDVIGLLVTPDGHMLLFVEGVLKILARCCEGLDQCWNSSLHAVVDLDGCTTAVRLLESNGVISDAALRAHAAFREAEHWTRQQDVLLEEDA